MRQRRWEITQAERDWCVAYCAATGATPETLHELQDYDGADDIHEVIERGRHLGTAHRPVSATIRACSADGVLSDPEQVIEIAHAQGANLLKRRAQHSLQRPMTAQ